MHSPVSTAAPRHWPRPVRLAAHARCHLHRDKIRTVRAAAGWVQQECRPWRCNSNSGATTHCAVCCTPPNAETTVPHHRPRHSVVLLWTGGGCWERQHTPALAPAETAQGWAEAEQCQLRRGIALAARGCSCTCPNNKHTCARRRCAAPATREDEAAACECLTGLADVSAPLGAPGTLTVSLIERVFNFGSAEGWLLAVAIFFHTTMAQRQQAPEIT